MSAKHLKRDPLKPIDSVTRHHVEHAWFYEENGGLCVVMEPSDVTRQVVIPVAAIRGYLARKDKKP